VTAPDCVRPATINESISSTGSAHSTTNSDYSTTNNNPHSFLLEFQPTPAIPLQQPSLSAESSSSSLSSIRQTTNYNSPNITPPTSPMTRSSPGIPSPRIPPVTSPATSSATLSMTRIYPATDPATTTTYPATYPATSPRPRTPCETTPATPNPHTNDNEPASTTQSQRPSPQPQQHHDFAPTHPTSPAHLSFPLRLSSFSTSSDSATESDSTSTDSSSSRRRRRRRRTQLQHQNRLDPLHTTDTNETSTLPPNNPFSPRRRRQRRRTPTLQTRPKQRRSLHQKRVVSTPNEPCGDTFTTTSHNGLRIWSNNINTLSLSNGLMAFRELCDRLKTHDVDIIALQELNLDTTQFQVRQQILQVLQETFGSVKMITASTPVTKASTTSKPGGVLLAIVGSCSHRVTTTQRDPFGRWCSATLAGRNQQDVRIYSAYQCVDDDINHTGDNTYYAQLWRLFREKTDRYPQPRRRFIKDLLAELITAKHANIALIILGDFNENIGTNPNLMASICSSIGLSDAVEHIHPQSENVPTYIRGRRRLDYGLLSHSLLPAVTASGLNQFHEISSSDHRALFIDLHLNHIFHPTTPIVNATLRHINSDSSAAKDFVAHAYEHLLQTNTFHKYATFLDQADTSPTPYILANEIDDQITRSLLSAENKIARPPRPPWSEKLHQASQQVRLWKIAKSGHLNELDISNQLNSAAADANFHGTFPTCIADINNRLPAQGPEDTPYDSSQCSQRTASIPPGPEGTHSAAEDT
jgi:endonuclease/exonuclease/phosphatase family metal-dependent hydrolase